MKSLLNFIIIGSITLLALWPFVAHGLDLRGWQVTSTLIINLVGWVLVLALLLARRDLLSSIIRVARNLGIETRFKSFEVLLDSVLKQVDRKNQAFFINLVERKISSKEELTRTLERIVSLAYKLLEAESAELALFDKDSGLYHSSFVLGKPFRRSAQAMLSGAIEGESEESKNTPDVMVQPVAFSGSMLGSLRVGLRKGKLPSQGDREIMSLLALQGGLAIVNAQYTQELVRMKKTSDESVKVKTGFLANLSHEIRAPLGIMLNAVELVLDGLCGAINQDQLETLKMVHSNGEHLLELINDVLDYAKIEAGRVTPQKVEILVNDVLKDVCNVVRAQADAKSHKLTFKSSDEVLTIHCDRRHMRQMLINLLTNAIKYTPDGGTIEVWAERIPGNKIKINVKDSGVGIERSERDKVFAPFERIQNNYSIKQVGAGLGMSLTQRLAAVNSALVDFESVITKGSHFWLIFQALEYNPAIVHHEAGIEPEAKGKGEAILLVEGNDGERSMIARYLGHIGFKIVAARSKAEAQQLFNSCNIELAIVDNNIVDNAEEDLLKTIRDSSKTNYLPIILISSRGFIFDIEKYLKAGIDRCLTKPIALKKLGLICRELIDDHYRGSIETKHSSSGKGESAAQAQTRVLRVDDIYH